MSYIPYRHHLFKFFSLRQVLAKLPKLALEFEILPQSPEYLGLQACAVMPTLHYSTDSSTPGVEHAVMMRFSRWGLLLS